MTLSRHPLRVVLLAALPALAIAIAGGALAQDRSGNLFDNLFSRGDPPQPQPGAARPIAQGDNAELSARIERIESALRQLTGTVEQLQHQNQLLQMQLQQLGARGANPMPPATITTSFPAASSTGQLAPNGPRTPITSPRLSLPIAFVTTPTARTVCVITPDFNGSPLIEIGTSPAPKT